MDSNRKLHNLTGQVARTLGMQIISGAFKPGDAFPIEGALCESLGVSRTTLREAVKNLAAKGLVSVGPSVGTRVRPQRSWNLLDRDLLEWKIALGVDRKFIRDIYEMRECFEPRASELAALHASKAERQAIMAAFEKMTQADGDPQLSVDADSAFHVSILANTGNDFLASLTSVVEAALRVSFLNARQRKPMSAADIDSHRRIAECIMARDGAGAHQATVDLLREARAIQLAALKPAQRSE